MDNRMDIAVRRTGLLMRATGLGDFPHEELAFSSMALDDSDGTDDVRTAWTPESWTQASDIGGFGPDKVSFDVCTAAREDIPDIRRALWRFISKHRDNVRWTREHVDDLHNQAIDADEDYGDEIESTQQEGQESERLTRVAENVLDFLEAAVATQETSTRWTTAT